jgi:flagellar hook-length control protein FliK
MNDMRLPSLGLLSSETPPHQGTADVDRDPAQAFDAVMSKFSQQRAPAPAPSSSQETSAKGSSNAARGQGKAAAGEGRSTQAGGQPVARTKPKVGDDDEGSDTAAAADAADPSTLVTVVNESAQLAAQNPALVALNAAAAAPGKSEAKSDCSVAATALDTLASKTNAIAGEAGKTIALDARSVTASNDDVQPVGSSAAPSRRAPAAAKDTLRIDAPLTRPFDAGKGDVAQRLSFAANAAVQAAQEPAASAETTSQVIVAGVAPSSSGAGTYSIAHAAVGAPVGTSAFASELSQRVVVFAGQKVQRAEIAVTPAELGPIAVSIEVRGQEATLAFAASSHATRAAIEDALPRLRDMLAAQGLQLAGTHVGSEPRRDPYRPAQNDRDRARNDRARDAAAPIAAPSNTEIRRRLNLIDIEV